MIKYREVLELRAEHGFFVNPLKPFDWSVPEDTARCLAASEILARPEAGRLVLLAPADRTLPEVPLDFLLHPSGPEVLELSSVVARPGQSAIVLDGASAPVVEISAVEIDAALRTIKVHVAGPDRAGRTVLWFDAAAVRFCYNLIGLGEDDTVVISDVLETVTFTEIEPLEVPGERRARRFCASMPVMLSERPPPRFRLEVTSPSGTAARSALALPYPSQSSGTGIDNNADARMVDIYVDVG